MDGFIHVVRCFESEEIPHLAGSIDARRDINTMDSELMLNDMIAVERRLEKLADEKKKGGGRDKLIIEREITLFQHMQSFLGEEKPLRDMAINADDEKLLAGFGFLSRKPVLIALNLSEGQKTAQYRLSSQTQPGRLINGQARDGNRQLPVDEAQIFLQEYGIEEPSLNRMIRLSYDLLGLQSFFTVGEDEVRAWTVSRGASALEAAGAIHTDLQKGFIRAEVVSYDDLITLGGMNEAKTHGKLRLEGKEYIVSDGDIVHIRFNV